MLDLSNTLNTLRVHPTGMAKNLMAVKVTATTRTYRFLFHNIRIQPFLITEKGQALLQSIVVSRFIYCNYLVAGLPSCAIPPLQSI